jgi:hypothetical protein
MPWVSNKIIVDQVRYQVSKLTQLIVQELNDKSLSNPDSEISKMKAEVANLKILVKELRKESEKKNQTARRGRGVCYTEAHGARTRR